ncbi:MAG: NAD(P)/FAD-dependent oxidoreductase [Candidatus Omnitrophica bacterium]|nr:NAD(P)/FAD-dependent oxidoreductase [Candidatus Omnitrophota bacterium]MDD5671096.1 NAD(P)/FAD-dependent oxidoreductase [Candidatus Omnitrophota bacterium]
MTEKTYDVIVIGAGASGIMTAIWAAKASLQVLLLDSRDKIGSKILISGGGRCNVTHRDVTEKDYASGNPRTLRNILRTFSSAQAVDFFREAGLEFVTEEDGKYFPKSGSARTVLDALTGMLEKVPVTVETGRKVVRVTFDGKLFLVEGSGFGFFSRTLAVCTGGLSYPETGSDGAGYLIAFGFGHRIVPTAPVLTPLTTDDPDWKNLSGIALPSRLSFWAGGKKVVASEGNFLFTHFGFSGPAVLDISRCWVCAEAEAKPELLADFLPEEEGEHLREDFINAARDYPRRSVERFLSAKLPERFVGVLLKKTGASPDMTLAQLRKEDREYIIRYLHHCPLKITGALGYEKAEVTAGGVDLNGVDSKTLESKLQPGLYFAGEVLDVDGRIGGFNFQWAWSSAVAVARAIAKRLG